MKNKVLVVIVTHNNPVLLEHMFSSIDKHDAGYEHDILVVDATSNNSQQLKLLETLAKKQNITIETYPDNRVEANYNVAWKNHKDYKYYFFSHDDMYVRVDNWLKLFVDRMNSGYCESVIKQTHYAGLPIGKVCIGTQFWRNYTNVLDYPVQCQFLPEVLNIIRPNKDPQIFKYCDGDRVMINSECMEATQGFRHVGEFYELMGTNPSQFLNVVDVLEKYLNYYDVGCFPKEMYPAGKCWAKLSLTAEFMSSIDPLIAGYRSVGLKDDGYLEQLHGFETPMQHDVISHYGSPNWRAFIGKQLGCDPEEVKKHYNNKVFLIKMNKIYDQWLQQNG